MKKFLALGSLVVLCALSSAAQWETSWHKALKKSESSKKPIMILFTGSDWCHYCQSLKAEVLDSKEFDAFAKSFVLLEIDMPRKRQLSKAQFEHNKALVDYFQIKGFPKILFLTAKGDVLGESGYMPGGPQAWIKATKAALGGK